MTPLHSVLRVAGGSALAGFAAGAVHAALAFAGRKHVLDFQGEHPAGFAEKALATAHTAAIEGIGFGAVGLVVGLLASVSSLSAVGGPERRARFASWVIVLGAAFFAWTSVTWIAGDVLPFLTKAELLALNLAGGLAAVLGFAFLVAVLRRLPWAPGGASAEESGVALVSSTLAAAVTGTVAMHQAKETLMSGDDGYLDPLRWGLVGCMVVTALLVGAALARWVRRPVLAVGARLEGGRLLPAPVTWVLGLGLVGCLVGTAGRFRMSSLPADVAYEALPEKPGASEIAGPNVVFVTIDTLRADHLGCYGYERPTSPFIDSIAEAGTRFDDPVSAAAWTKPATGTLFTGLHPSRHGALYHGSSLHLPAGMQTLAEAFRERGYATAGFVSNPNIKAIFEFDRGFDVFFDSPVKDTLTLACIRTSWIGRIAMDLLRHQFNWKYENDVHQMNRHVGGWLAQNHERPFYLYVHYIDPHIPYEPPEKWREVFAQDHGFPILNTNASASSGPTCTTPRSARRTRASKRWSPC